MDSSAAGQAKAIDLEAEPPFRVGGASIDPVSREAEYAGGQERLQPQTLKVLVALTRRRNQVVTRHELVDCCWDGRIVGDDVINRCISLLRDFAERAGGFSIETVPKTGYRLVEAEAGSKGWSRRWLAAIGAMLLAAVAAIAVWWPSTGPNATTVAVIAPDRSRITQELSRSLLTRLGSLQAAKTDSMKLVGLAERSGSDADLIFEVSGTSNRGTTEANVVLLAGKDRSVLWSK